MHVHTYAYMHTYIIWCYNFYLYSIHPIDDTEKDSIPLYDHLDTAKCSLETMGDGPLYDHLDTIEDKMCSPETMGNNPLYDHIDTSEDEKCSPVTMGDKPLYDHPDTIEDKKCSPKMTGSNPLYDHLEDEKCSSITMGSTWLKLRMNSPLPVHHGSYVKIHLDVSVDDDNVAPLKSSSSFPAVNITDS